MTKKKTATKRTTKKTPVTENTTKTENAARRRFLDIVENAQTSRSQLIKGLLDRRRDIDDECGYPENWELTAEDYRVLYDREAVATRVVEVWPKESWKVQPTVFETEDVDVETEFEAAWKEVGNKLGGKSWHRQEEGNRIWSHLLQADIDSGVGSYGIILLGFNDGKELKEPVEIKKGMELLSLKVFDETLAEITTYESDRENERFGKPTQYLVTFNDPNEQRQLGIGANTTTETVHHSRVIHIADSLSNDVFARPRLRPVYNRLYDTRKLYGGAGEMYWRGAFPGLSIESNPQLAGDVDFDVAELRGQIENYMNTLQRYIATTGFQVKSLAPQVVDPTPQIDAVLKAICIQLEIPKRVFEGSERGELASSQDTRAWNGRLQNRQNIYVTPRIVVPFIDRMILVGVLPEPPEGYNVVWPDLDSLTDLEQATIAVQRMDAAAKYIQGNVVEILSPMDFHVREMGMTADEAEEVLEAAAEAEPLIEPVEEEIDDATTDEGAGGDAGRDRTGEV